MNIRKITNLKKIKGWVDQIRLNQGKYIIYDIQADDEWNGARGTFITTELGEVVKLENKSRPESRC